jgi:hypothetical protein
VWRRVATLIKVMGDELSVADEHAERHQVDALFQQERGDRRVTRAPTSPARPSDRSPGGTAT